MTRKETRKGTPKVPLRVSLAITPKMPPLDRLDIAAAHLTADGESMASEEETPSQRDCGNACLEVAAWLNQLIAMQRRIAKEQALIAQIQKTP